MRDLIVPYCLGLYFGVGLAGSLFLRGIPAIKNRVPEPLPPAVSTDAPTDGG